jgi:PAP2 superfamily protein
MKRLAALASVVAGLAFTGVSLARQPHAKHNQSKPTPTQPDQVLEWNQNLLALVQAPGAQPTSIHPTRTLAITELAVYDAVNAIDRQDAPYLFHGPAPRGASANAAAASAARTALLALLPTQQSAIDADFQTSLTQLGSGPHVRRGIRVGEEAANAILAVRANDGATATPPTFVPQFGPGNYQLTTQPNPKPAVFTQTGHVTPFVLNTQSQFRPPAPPALTSPRYADDFNEVKSLGRLTSTTRSADQTDIGRFWGAAPIWIVWNQIAEQAASAFHNSVAQNARLFGVLNATLGDSAIALYDAKYTYARWRPITAITALDQGNINTIGDPTWAPLATTANDPSYPGAHADFSAAAATVLADFFGTDGFAFSLTNATVGITRSFESFSAAADEAAASRIFAGQHFRYDEDAGEALGADVADFVFDHALLPVVGPHSTVHHHRHAAGHATLRSRRG